MSNWQSYNPNPKGKRTGDCVVRALSKALNQSWQKTFIMLSIYGFYAGDMANANIIFGYYLEDKGFKQYLVDRHGKRVYTVDDFCQDHPQGTYILAIDGHVVCVESGKYFDSWDSGGEIPIYYWTKG